MHLKYASVIALTVLLSTSFAHADNKKPSRIFGKVTQPDGKPAANMAVKVAPLAYPPKNSGGGSHRRNSLSLLGMPMPTFLFGDPAPIATVQTDASGAYSFKTIPVGVYRVSAGDMTTAYCMELANVAGEGADVELDLALVAPDK